MGWTGLSKGVPLTATVDSKAPLAGLAELVGAIWAQTVMLQSQLMTQEWLVRKLEHVAITLN